MNPRALVLVLATAALLARLYCAATTVGTSDVVPFWKFAAAICWKNDAQPNAV